MWGEIAGAVAGGLLGGSDSGSEQKNTTTSSTGTSSVSLPQWLQDAGANYYNQSANAANRTYQANPYLKQASWTQDQTDAQQMIRDTAKAGNSTYTAANQNMTDTLNGKYLSPDSNPWLKSTVNTALDGVQSRVGSQFAMGGAFGGSANQEMLQKGLGETSASMYGANYEAERRRQMQAASLARTMQAAGYTDANALNALGAQQQQYNQNDINNAYTSWNNEWNYPQEQLQYLANGLRGATGTATLTTNSSSTGTNPYFTNTNANIVGGMTTGAALGSEISSLFN